jgi:Tfp pilus assembly protein FimT
MLVVLAIGGVLMAIGAPALLNTVQAYKVHVSAQQLEIFARQARYESIKRGMMVSVVPDTPNRSFYMISGSPPPAADSFANGVESVVAANRIGVLQMPGHITFVATTFSFNSDGSGSGGPVTFNLPGYPSSKVTLATPATGKLLAQF